MTTHGEALAALDKAEAIRPNHWTNQARRAALFARGGRRRETLRMIDEFKAAKIRGTAVTVFLFFTNLGSSTATVEFINPS